MNRINPFSIVLILNSVLLISLIVTQNDNTKDSTNQNTSRTTPLQIFIFWEHHYRTFCIFNLFKSYGFLRFLTFENIN